jgi:hypothetical protein
MRFSKCKILLLMLLTFSLTNLFGQAANVTLKMKDASLSDILMEINKKTSYEVQFFSNDVKDYKGITIDLNNAGIEEAIKKCLEKTNLAYVIKGKTIAVSKSIDGGVSPQQVTEIEIKGRITDINGEPLSGATVMVKGVTGRGSIAGPDGTYSLKTRSDARVLVFSFIGFETKEENIGGRSVINVQMQVSAQLLDNVVITGFQNIPKGKFYRVGSKS